MQNISGRSWLDPVFRKRDETILVAAEIPDFVKPICFFMLVVNPLPDFSLSSITLKNCFFYQSVKVFLIIMHIRKIIGTLGQVHCCVISCFHSPVYFISEFKEKFWIFLMSTIPHCYLSNSEIQFCML